MDFKKLFVGSLVVNVGLIAVAGFLYIDSSSRSELISDLTKERDEAIEKTATAENELKKLQGKLSLIGSNETSEDEASLKKSLDEKDAEIARLKAQLDNGGNRPPRNGGPGGPGGPGG
ncbi:MAG: hypothetical protein J5833_08020, partial [Victivallales bacterium]|nr:hypothetical protein [Victivallales bacterium]